MGILLNTYVMYQCSATPSHTIAVCDNSNSITREMNELDEATIRCLGATNMSSLVRSKTPRTIDRRGTELQLPKTPLRCSNTFTYRVFHPDVLYFRCHWLVKLIRYFLGFAGRSRTNALPLSLGCDQRDQAIIGHDDCTKLHSCYSSQY